MPGGASRFDYQSLDPTTGRLYIAHMGAGQLVVFDTKHRAVVGTVADLPMVTGVLAVPALGHVYAAVAGDHQVDVVDNRLDCDVVADQSSPGEARIPRSPASVGVVDMRDRTSAAIEGAVGCLDGGIAVAAGDDDAATGEVLD